MTLSATVTSVRYTGTGAETPLNTTFEFFSSSEIEVWQRVTATGIETKLTENTHYTVSGGGVSGVQPSSTGTVTPDPVFIAAATHFTTLMTWELRRVLPLTQTTDYAEGTAFPAISTEAAFDRSVMVNQQLRGEVLLAQTSSDAVSNIQVVSEDWPSLYDSVRLEMVNILAASAARFNIKTIDNGSVVVTGQWMTSLTLAGANSGVTTSEGEGWATHASYLLGAGATDKLAGEAVIWHTADGYMTGRVSVTYDADTLPARVFTQMGVGRTTAATRLDGFDLSFAGGVNISGTARLWGRPRS